MAILRNGLAGGLTGKLGNAIYYLVNGKQMVRIRTKSSKPPTQKQLFNRAEMGIVNSFLRPIKALINLGYGIEARKSKRAPYNMAFSYVKKYALKGTGGDRQIDYTKIQLSMGNLPNVWDAEAMLNEDELIVSWSPECNWPGWGSDRVIVLAYFPPMESNQSAMACFTLCGIKRTAGQEVIQLPSGLIGRAIEVYVFVQAADGRSISSTLYLGRIG